MKVENGYSEKLSSCGKFLLKANYHNGKFHGFCAFHNLDGTIRDNGTFNNGLKDGYFETFWNDKGGLKITGTYENDIKVGKFSHYDSYSKLTEEKYFI